MLNKRSRVGLFTHLPVNQWATTSNSRQTYTALDRSLPHNRPGYIGLLGSFTRRLLIQLPMKLAKWFDSADALKYSSLPNMRLASHIYAKLTKFGRNARPFHVLVVTEVLPTFQWQVCMYPGNLYKPQDISEMYRYTQRKLWHGEILVFLYIKYW